MFAKSNVTSSSADTDNDNNNDNELMDIFANTIENMFLQLVVTDATRDNINKVASSIKVMINTIEALVTSKTTEECDGEILFLFSNLKEIVEPFSTDYKRKQQIQEHPAYVKPVPVCFGTIKKPVRYKNKQIELVKPLILYTIPVRETLKTLFNNHSFGRLFFESTMNHHCSTGIYSNVCCGSEFEKSGLRNKTVLVIQLYYDGVNLGDALKQNCNTYKIGAFYFRILNLPPEMQSLDRNIYLCGLFNENDLKDKKEGLNAVLKYIIDMFSDLEINGLEVETDDGEKVLIEIAVLSLACDNLACHQLVGN